MIKDGRYPTVLAKIGDQVSYSGAVLGEKGKTSQFSVKEIKEEYPCTYYIIEDIKTHKQIVAFWPEPI